MKAKSDSKSDAASARFAKEIHEIGGWHAEMLAHVRDLIREADPNVIEEIKWRKPSNPAGVPVWSDGGIICTGEAHTAHVRITFARGASIEDPEKVFNSGFNGKVFRAIVLHEGDKVNEPAFKKLIQAAAAVNSTAGRQRSAKRR